MSELPISKKVHEQRLENTAHQQEMKEQILDLIAQSAAFEQQNDLTLALNCLDQAWHIFQSTTSEKSDELQALLLFHLSHIYLKRQDYKKLSELSEPLLELSWRLNDAEKEVSALTNLAIVKSIESDYVTAIPLLVDALEKSQKLGFRNTAANCLVNIGNIYAHLFNYDEALDRYRTALNDYEDILSDDTAIAIKLNTGNIYYASERYTESLGFFKNAIESALALGKKTLAARACVLVSRSYLDLGETDLAVENTFKASTLIDNIDKVSWRSINLLNLAHIQFSTGNTEGGYKKTILGIATARRFKDDVSELRGFKLLSEIFKKEKNYERALRSQMVYSQKQNDYLKMQRNMHILDFEIRYALSEKERKIEVLTKENRYQALLLERNSQIEKQNEQLRQANEELQQFAYISSHDLKEPLRMIGSFAQIIEQQYASKLGGESKSYFQFINEGVSRMHGLLDALLQYATIGKVDLELEPVDVQEVVNIARTNLTVKIEETDANVLCGEMPTVKAIPSFLVQLFQNLISNAIKFRQEESRPIILINAEERSQDWLFSVEDNGIGIAEEHKERIFIIFQRLHKRNKYEGTGIGLAICHKIVSQLVGKIWIESVLGKGTTFFFTIPK
jgi:signal transduction histidine kinase